MPHSKFSHKIKRLLFFAAFLPAISSAAKPPQLEVINNGVHDCGCGIYRTKNKFLILIGPLEKDSAVIATGGKKRRLKWASSNRPEGPPKDGQKYTEVYEGETLKLTLNYKTLQACAGPEPDKCSIAKYSVKSVLQEGRRKTAANDLRADCGC